MNVKDPLFPHSSISTDSPTPASAPSVVPVPTTIAESSEPTQHYWTMSSYLAISLPLTTVVVVLPLIAPPCFRFLLQKYERHRRHWHALIVVSILWYFIATTSLFYTGGWIYNWLAYLFMGYLVLCMIGLTRVIQAYRAGNGRIRWSLQMILMGMCVWADLAEVLDIPWALVTYLYMFLTSNMSIKWLRGSWFWLDKRMRSLHRTSELSNTTV